MSLANSRRPKPCSAALARLLLPACAINPVRSQRERQECAPPEPDRTRAESLDTVLLSMNRREAERLAVELIRPAAVCNHEHAGLQAPLTEPDDCCVARCSSPKEAGPPLCGVQILRRVREVYYG